MDMFEFAIIADGGEGVKVDLMEPEVVVIDLECGWKFLKGKLRRKIFLYIAT